MNNQNKYWELQPVIVERDYIPDSQEIAEMEEVERQQQECKHVNFNDEDGCLDCGFYAK